jgi:hypothetical protein
VRRLALLAAVALAAPALVPAPATASGGTLTIECQIAYTSNGSTYDVTGDCTLAGVLLDGFVGAGPARLVGSAYVATGICPLTSTVSGVIYGGPIPPLSIAWTRVGVYGAVNTAGPVNGSGPVVFSSGPCSPGLTETVAMQVAGT